MYSKHILQTEIWAKVRESQGWKAYNVNGAYLLVKTVIGEWGMGYMPQVDVRELHWNKLAELGKQLNLIYIHLDPHNLKSEYAIPQTVYQQYDIAPAPEIYYRHSAILDLSKSEEELLSAMKQKTRYNVNLARKKGVSVEISDSPKSFEIFLDLFFATVSRQQYFGRNPEYYRQIWAKMQPTGHAKIAIASYEDTPLVAWMLYLDPESQVMYYPYGGSSELHRDVMATYGLVWELVLWGKQNGYRYFDLWGTLGPDAHESDPKFGFHRFKLGFGGEEITYMDALDIVINPGMYMAFNLANNLRWGVLKLAQVVKSHLRK